MGFIARERVATTFTDAIALEALERVLPATVLQGAAVDAAVPTERRRKLLLCVAMGLFWPDRKIALASKSAISQARYRLGARPVVGLFHRLCQPLATAQTPGAYRFGLRVGSSQPPEPGVAATRLL